MSRFFEAGCAGSEILDLAEEVWDRYSTDWTLLDGEIMPSSAKAVADARLYAATTGAAALSHAGLFGNDRFTWN